MDIRVAAVEKYQYAEIFMSSDTQLELIHNMEYFGRVNAVEEFVLSYFTDKGGNKVMLLMQSFHGKGISGFSSERSFQEFRERIMEFPQVVHQSAKLAHLFPEAAQFCETNGCKSGYNLAICG